MLKRAHWFGIALLALLLPLGILEWGCQGTCTQSSDCASDEFCSMANGACLTSRPLGFCQPQPDTCIEDAVIVCGCDGNTYANACEASLAGVSAASLGVCAIPCGGPKKLACPSHQFCQFLNGNCGLGDVFGECEPIPTTCEGQAPSEVCDCNGKTRSSACEAEREGLSLSALSACPCGGPDNIACEPGRFCDLIAGTCGGPTPASGLCEVPPTTCAPFINPVCGCDFKNHDNLCEAAKAQVSIFSLSSCPCGGPDNFPCPAGDYCEFGVNGTAGNCLYGNPYGNCLPKPTECVPVLAEICGCDNNTYANPCEAEKAGFSVALFAPCMGANDAGAGGD